MDLLGDDWTVSDHDLISQRDLRPAPSAWTCLKMWIQLISGSCLPSPCLPCLLCSGMVGLGAGWQGPSTACLVTMLDVWLPVLEGSSWPLMLADSLYAEDAPLARELS